MTKVVFVSEVPAPYRSPLFERLLDTMELNVLYCAATDPWRGPVKSELGSHEEVLPGSSFGGRLGGVNWKFNPAVWRRLSALHPDVVVVSGYAHPTLQLAILWSRVNKVPYILHSESNDLTPRPIWRRMLKAPTVKWAISGASAFLPVSSSAADYLARRGADMNEMFILPNAPDIDRLATVTRAAAPGDHPPTFIFVGRLVPAKDVPTLLEAFAIVRSEVPDAHLLIIGEGPLRSTLESSCEQRGIGGVDFIGFVGQEELVAYYAMASCFVLPSIMESYGVVVLEAMAAGLPVVLSDRVGSAGDLVRQGENGFVFPVGDSAQLARRMLDVLAEDGLRMGLRSREIALGFNYDASVEAIAAALRCARGGPVI